MYIRFSYRALGTRRLVWGRTWENGWKRVADELEQLAVDLTRIILKGLGARSKWALKTAIDAAGTEGVSGICTLHIPVRAKDEVELVFMQVDHTTMEDRDKHYRHKNETRNEGKLR